MRIRHKIFLGYVALLSIAVVLVVFFLFTLSDINRSYVDLISRDQQILLQAENLRSGVQRQIVAARTYEQIGDLSLLVEYQGAVREQQNAFRAMEPLVSNPEDKQALDGIMTASEQYSILAREAMDLSRRPNGDISTLSLKRLQGETARLALINSTESFLAKK